MGGGRREAPLIDKKEENRMAFEKDMNNAQERARKVKLFGHDIHGTLTSNTLTCDIEGNRRYGFWHMDGFGDLSLTANEIKIAFLDTTSIDGEGLFRAKDISYAEVGYLGCELSDIPAMKKVGFGVATADAIDEVKTLACYITNAPGGRGAMREICEFILRAMDKWDGWVEKVTKMGYK
jgi:3-deoxy-D-manno-octulosonate 8-phosphate phosphatase (KDO 8-P phosphatase)